jgi:hypothetical protein
MKCFDTWLTNCGTIRDCIGTLGHLNQFVLDEVTRLDLTTTVILLTAIAITTVRLVAIALLITRLTVRGLTI